MREELNSRLKKLLSVVRMCIVLKKVRYISDGPEGVNFMFESHMKQIKIVGGIAVVLLVTLVAVLVATRPYAVSASGDKIFNPWVVKAGDKEIAYVETESEGKDVIEGIKKAYYKGREEPKDLEIAPAVTVEHKDLSRGEDPIKLKNVKAAVDKVVAANKTDKPLVNVSYTATEKTSKKIKYRTVCKKTSSLEKGVTEVARSGKNGKKIIKSSVRYENGEAIKTVIISKNIAKKAVNKVIYKGTKEPEPDVIETASRGADASGRETSGDETSNSGDSGAGGQSVADYACQFIGNPYVYGGSSLTDGTDCSGFVMSVYAKYGVSLPHSAGAIGGCGTGVSYDNAVPGDVFVYPGHCGIYIGGGQIVHASDYSTGICIGNANYTTPVTIRHML